MKAQSLATLVAVAASLQGVVATGWHNFPPFDCPGKNPPHTCVPDQHGGFDWKDLLPGPFDHFGGFDFSGFTCKRSFGKRGEIVERTFGDSKCITGVAHSDKNKCPKIRGNKVDKFSITHIKVSVEFDCDLEFHYTLPDNSVCKQKSHCKKSGTVVKNDQCGGAKDVTVVYPKPKHGGKDHCNIGIHHIDFDCPPTTTSSAVQSTTTSPPDTTTETGPDTTAPPDTTTETGPDTTAPPDTTTETGPDTTAPPDTTTETGPDTTAPPDTTTETGPDTTAPPDTTTETGPDTTAPPDTTTETGPDTTAPPDTTTETGPDTTAPPDTTTETGPDTTSPPDNTEGPSTVITTVITDVTVTTCPVTKTHVTSGVTSIETTLTTSTILITTTKTVCHRCTGKPQPPQTTGGSSPGGVPCPDILPQCIKTWLPVECKSNSDTACFCPKKDFTDKLFECLAAHGATDDEIDDAAEYFQGICAPYVPTNPGIVTACPPKGTGGSKPHTVPVTTITVHTTVTVPCEPTGTETATSFTLTTISTEVTVPQVTLTSTTGGVVIVTGPATVGATATPAPVFTTVATVPGAASGTNSRPTATSPPFNSGASRGYVGAGLLGAVMAVAALFV